MPINKLTILCSLMAVALAAGSSAGAQVSINIGAEPACPYGYFDYAPYACAPAGYYGPEWFSGGAFIGAGPWHRGPAEFRGHVNNRFDPHHGYKGRLPEHTNVAVNNFHGNEVRDGRGHEVRDERGGGRR